MPMRTSPYRLPRHPHCGALLQAILAWTLVPFFSASAAEPLRSFPTAETAATQLAEATRSFDPEALRSILGHELNPLSNPDRVQGTNECRSFVSAFDRQHRILRSSDSGAVLEVGTNGWVFPVPLVQVNGRWAFDPREGSEELTNRRIGRNELGTLAVLRAYVDAQREYASKDRDGDDILEYAQRLASTPGTTDGLYWPPEVNGETSPLGPMVAEADGHGYDLKTRAAYAPPEPYEGYYFKILTGQGRHAPGGRYSYIINGHMIGGFAMVAWPAEYGHSGVMTFVVNQQGKVYQKDLGTRTATVARRMNTYDPESSWTLSRE